MLTYLTYADRMLEIVKILVEVSDDNSSRSLPTRLISVAALLRLLSHVPALAHSNLSSCRAKLSSLHDYVQGDQVGS